MIVRRLAALAVALFLALPAFAQSPEAPKGGQAPVMDRATVERIVREYLLSHPEVLVEAMTELQKKQQAASEDRARQVIAERRQEILSDPATPVGGNPKGDVTVVEFFDYHCGYCKQVHQPLLDLAREDKGVRIVYKEMPILAPESRIAAQAALAAERQGKYVVLHNALMEARGKLTKDRILGIAKERGLDTARLAKDMELPEIGAAIDRNLDLAAALDISGTPAFVIGDQLVPGAIGMDAFRALVAQARGRE